MHEEPNPHRFGRTSAAPRRSASLLLALGAAIVAGGIALVEAGPSAHAQDADRLDGTRATLEEWVRVRRLMSEARQEWRLGEEILRDQIDAARRRITEIEEDTVARRGEITSTDERREELLAERDTLKAASAALAERVAELEGRVLDLLTRLPEPIVDRVRILSQEIPTEGEDVELSLSQRFQNIVGVLNDVNRFHSEITIVTENRDLPDGTTAQVQAIYFGIAHGYYVGKQGTVAGIGSTTSEGWTWRVRDDIAPDVARLVAILRNEEVADFVQLPVQVVD